MDCDIPWRSVIPKGKKLKDSFWHVKYHFGSKPWHKIAHCPPKKYGIYFTGSSYGESSCMCMSFNNSTFFLSTIYGFRMDALWGPLRPPPLVICSKLQPSEHLHTDLSNTLWLLKLTAFSDEKPLWFPLKRKNFLLQPKLKLTSSAEVVTTLWQEKTFCEGLAEEGGVFPVHLYEMNWWFPQTFQHSHPHHYTPTPEVFRKCPVGYISSVRGTLDYLDLSQHQQKESTMKIYLATFLAIASLELINVYIVRGMFSNPNYYS